MGMFLLGAYCLGAYVVGANFGWLNPVREDNGMMTYSKWGVILWLLSPITVPLGIILVSIVG